MKFWRMKMIKVENITNPKEDTEEKKYYEAVKKSPDLIHYMAGAEPHHTRTGGKGRKCPDYLAIPLRPKHHKEYHDKGILTWVNKYFRGIATEYICPNCGEADKTISKDPYTKHDARDFMELLALRQIIKILLPNIWEKIQRFSENPYDGK